jgi:subtilisin family serine protease
MQKSLAFTYAKFMFFQLRVFLLSSLLLLGACGIPGADRPEISEDTFVVDRDIAMSELDEQQRYLVAFYDAVPDWVQPYVVRKVMEKHHLYIINPPDGDFVTRMKADPGVRFCEAERHYKTPIIQAQPLSQEQLDRLSRHHNFKTQFVPDDTSYDLQWNMRAIGMEKAWDLRKDAQDIVVAVIDSGVDPDHPDLQGNLLPVEDIWGEFSGSDRLLNRRTRELFDFAGRDGNGHGTHVAGVIGAILNNNEGVAGIAGQKVKILPIKVTNLQGETSAALLVEAILRAIDKKARVINMSIGAVGADQGISRGLSLALDAALQQGITIVAASGNESDRVNNIVTDVSLPAAYPGVVSVGAFLEDGTIANYSNGGETLDVLAPGGSGGLGRDGFPVISTWPTYPAYEFLTNRVSTLSYAGISGTSMATPHVAAVAALILAQEPDLTPQQVRSRLIATATDVGPVGFDNDSGYGLLNAEKALVAKGDGPRL